jgi:anti-sigma factor (TIGR02949 family)
MKQRDRFTCEEAFRRLDDYLDRELAGSEMSRVRDHLETCAACAREFTFEASVLDRVKSKLRQIDVPPDVLSRVTAALDRDRNTRSFEERP